MVWSCFYQKDFPSILSIMVRSTAV